MPKVSVITPVYNAEQYIESAIDSLLGQTCQDWDLIVVDDGSSDATPQILQKFSGEARIKVIRQDNAGEAAARNVGIEHATGDYLAFLDADDAFFPNALEDLSSFLDRHPDYDVAYSNGLICDSSDKVIMHLNDVRPGFFSGKILEQVVISSSVITVPICTMTRRLKVVEHSIRFDRNLVIGPDWDFWIQLAAAQAGFGFLDTITCKYRVHSTNITKKVDLRKRRKDQFFGRSKVMNSTWFDELSLGTRMIFYVDLLTNILTGDQASQRSVLEGEVFAKLPVGIRAYLWRMAAIDVLQTDPDTKHARDFLLEAVKLNHTDRKNRLVLWSLGLGRGFALGLIRLWRFALQLANRPDSRAHARSMQLQKLFGLR